MGTKLPGFDRNPAIRQSQSQGIYQGLGLRRRSRPVERGSAAFRHRPGQRELGYQKNGSPHSGRIQVHSALVVFEDSQAHELVCGSGYLIHAVSLLDPNQNQESMGDLGHFLLRNHDGGRFDSLQDQAHVFRLTNQVMIANTQATAGEQRKWSTKSFL
jgi:hypothetical protein